MPAVLVLGADGMLGHIVVDVLQATGLRVELATRSGAQGYHFDVEQGPHRLRALLRECRVVDYIVNCIGIVSGRIEAQRPSSVRQAVAVNSLFPFELASVAAEADLRVLHVWTDGVFSGRSAAPYVEETPVDAEDVYGRTKSLGEVVSPHVLNLRCSIVGPDPVRKRGLLEWFLARPDGSSVDGFVDHFWNGVTSRQLGELCATVIDGGWFDELRSEGAVHHYCPNQTLSKYELLTVFRELWTKDVIVRPVPGRAGALNRVLATSRRTLPAAFGRGRSMRDALSEIVSGGQADRMLLEPPAQTSAINPPAVESR